MQNPAYGYDVVLAWSPSDGGGQVAGYRLYRQQWGWDSSDSSYDRLLADYQQIQTIDDGSSDTTDTTTACGYMYRYFVTAYDTSGQVSEPSNEATADVTSCYAG